MTTTDNNDYVTPITWVTQEYPHYEKDATWYTVLALIAAGIIVVSFAFGDALLALMVLMAAFAIGVQASRRPQEITVRLEGTTLQVGESVYDLEEIESFWIHYEPPDEPLLLLRSHKALMPLISVPLDEQDPVELRRVLRTMLPEEKEEISAVDHIAKLLRF